MHEAPTEVTWTQEQVDGLNDYQRNGFMHPFTCASGNRTDASHSMAKTLNNDRDWGLLVAKTDGWHCPACNYRQFWAHDFMFKGRGRNPFPWREG